MSRPWLVLGAGGLLGRHLVSELRGWPRVTSTRSPAPTARGRGEGRRLAPTACDRRPAPALRGAATPIPSATARAGAGGSLELLAPTRAECDITDPRAVAAAARGVGVVINCAAWTDVDGAEAEPAAALAVNRDGAGHVARAAALTGAALVHLSTDFIFDGEHAPYTPEAPARPVSVYGRTKLAGERRVLAEGGRAWLVRVQALYGAGGRGFSSRLFDLLEAGATGLRLDAERRVQPTWARLAARQLIALVRRAPPGIYHVSCKGEATWAAFAHAAAARLGAPARFAEVASADLAAPAARPADCRFDHGALARAGCDAMPQWRVGLDGFVAERRGGGGDPGRGTLPTR